jgi:hypothetical protein
MILERFKVLPKDPNRGRIFIECPSEPGRARLTPLS